MQNNKLVFYDGAKAVSILSDEGWTVTGDAKTNTYADLAGKVAIVYRGMNIRANAVASIPFELIDVKTKEVVDTSDEWKNVCGFLPNPEDLFWRLEAAWTVHGKAYCYKSDNSSGYTKIFRPLAPLSVEYSLDKDEFKRDNKKYSPAVTLKNETTKGESIVYLWMPDPDVEHGEPKKWPANAAFKAMDVIYSLDEASSGFFKRGMLHATIFSVPPGTQEKDKEELESRINNMFRGVKNWYKALFFNGESIKPVDIGGSLKDIENINLTKDKREDVAIALGIPMSKLFTESAAGLGGGGVVAADDKRLILDTALPDWKMLARELNRQVFLPRGWMLVDKHEQMEMFKEGQKSQADVITAIVGAFQTNPELANIIADEVGLDFSEDGQKKLDAYIAEKKQSAVVAPAQPAQPEPQNDQSNLQSDMAKFMKKALKKVGQSVNFESEYIPLEVVNFISMKLPECKSDEDVKKLFANPHPVEVNKNDRLADEIKEARLLLESIKHD